MNLTLIPYFPVKRKALWLLLILILFSLQATAQYNSPKNRVWAFGDRAGLDFNTGNPVPIQTNMNILEGCASISDTNGQLLFYTNGTKIWNRNHSVMPHGDSLCGDPNNYPTNSTTQSSLIIPMFNDPGKYYLFTLSDANDSAHYGRLTYSVVNMGLNSGDGDIVPGSKAIPVDSILSEKLTAVQGDHCNIWLIVHTYNSNVFKAYEITDAGINFTPVLSATGGFNPPAYYYGGVIKGSPDRKWIISCTYGGAGATGISELFRFDPATGQMSSFAVLSNNAFNTYYGAEFSADNSRLYITGQSNSIYQYDLTLGSSSAIINSATDITQNAAVAGITQGDMKLGPDGKIYIAQLFSSFIGIIDNPGLAGTACGYLPNNIQLLPNTQSLIGLPNHVITLQEPVSNTTSTSICYFSDSCVFSADPDAWDILWDDGSINNTRSAYHSGSYSVSYYTPPCTYHADTFILHTPTLSPINGLTPPGCKGEHEGRIWSHPATGDSTTYTYTWKDATGSILSTTTHALEGDTLSGLGPGIYTLYLQGAGCDTTFTFNLPAPDYTVSFTTDTLICFGDTIQFNNTSTGSFSAWAWSFNDSTFSGDPDPIHVYRSPGIYRVWLIGETATGCSDTAIANITVDRKFDGSFLKDQKEICTGRSIIFSPLTDSSALQLFWDFGDGTYRTLPNEIVQHAYDRNGIMPLQLNTHFRACPDAVSYDTVYVYPYPAVQLPPDSSLCLDGAPIFLKNRADQPAGYAHLWSTGETSQSILIRHPGTYWLKVTSDHGCSTSEYVTVSKNCYIDIPNAFSPNGDGINDYFFPRQWLSKGGTRFKMQVFSRWGQLLFETDKINGRGWDGQFNNRPQPPGVYIYIIESGIGAPTEKYQGNLTLMR